MSLKEKIFIERNDEDEKLLLKTLNELGFSVPPQGGYTTLQGLKFIPVTHPNDFEVLLQHKSKNEFWNFKPGGSREENLELYFKLNQEFWLDVEELVRCFELMRRLKKVIVLTRRYYDYNTQKRLPTKTPSPVNPSLWFTSPLELFDLSSYLYSVHYYRGEEGVENYLRGNETLAALFKPKTKRRLKKTADLERVNKKKQKHTDFFIVPIKNELYGQDYWFKVDKSFVRRTVEWDIRLDSILASVKRDLAEQKSLVDFGE